MGELIGLGGGLALLYFWLIGHWFARVVVFLLFAISGALMADGDAQYGALTLLAGFGGGWLIASAPTWFHQRKAEQQKETRRDRSEPFIIPYPRVRGLDPGISTDQGSGAGLLS